MVDLSSSLCKRLPEGIIGFCHPLTKKIQVVLSCQEIDEEEAQFAATEEAEQADDMGKSADLGGSFGFSAKHGTLVQLPSGKRLHNELENHHV